MTDGFWIFLLPFKTFSFFIKVPLSASKSPRALVTWPSPVQPRRRARGGDQLLGSCFKSRRVYHINNRGVTPSECLLLSVFRIPEIPQSSRSKGTARTQIIRCSIVISLRGHGLLLEPLCGRVKRELSTVRGVTHSMVMIAPQKFAYGCVWHMWYILIYNEVWGVS